MIRVATAGCNGRSGPTGLHPHKTIGRGRLELPTSRLSGLRSGSDPFRIKPVILRQTPIPTGVGAGSLPVSNHLDPARYHSRQRNEQRKKWGERGSGTLASVEALADVGTPSHPLPHPVTRTQEIDSWPRPSLEDRGHPSPHGSRQFKMTHYCATTPCLTRRRTELRITRFALSLKLSRFI